MVRAQRPVGFRVLLRQRGSRRLFRVRFERVGTRVTLDAGTRLRAVPPNGFAGQRHPPQELHVLRTRFVEAAAVAQRLQLQQFIVKTVPSGESDEPNARNT